MASTLIRKIFDYLFGYDFFISYCWKDGREYALELNKKLESYGFKCFLDSSEYAKGDNWREQGSRALKKTSRLILVGTPFALDSEPVLAEVRIFSQKGGRIIPINIDGSLNQLEKASGLGKYLSPDVIMINEHGDDEPDFTSNETVSSITQSFTIARQEQKRLRLISAVALLLFLTTCISIGVSIVARNLLINTMKSENDLTVNIALEKMGRGDVSSAQNDVLRIMPTDVDSVRPYSHRGESLLYSSLYNYSLKAYELDADFPEHTSFTRDGDMVIVFSSDGTISLHSKESGELEKRINTEYKFDINTKYSPESGLLFYADPFLGEGLAIVDPTTATVIADLNMEGGEFQVSENGKYIATFSKYGGASQVAVYSAVDGRPLKDGPSGKFESVSLSDSGELNFVVDNEQECIKLPPEFNECGITPGAGLFNSSYLYLPSSNAIVISSYREMEIWDAESKQILYESDKSGFYNLGDSKYIYFRLDNEDYGLPTFGRFDLGKNKSEAFRCLCNPIAEIGDALLVQEISGTLEFRDIDTFAPIRTVGDFPSFNAIEISKGGDYALGKVSLGNYVIPLNISTKTSSENFEFNPSSQAKLKIDSYRKSFSYSAVANPGEFDASKNLRKYVRYQYEPNLNKELSFTYFEGVFDDFRVHLVNQNNTAVIDNPNNLVLIKTADGSEIYSSEKYGKFAVKESSIFHLNQSAIALNEVNVDTGRLINKYEFVEPIVDFTLIDNSVVGVTESGEVLLPNPDPGILSGLSPIKNIKPLIVEYLADSGLVVALSKASEIAIWDIMNPKESLKIVSVPIKHGQAITSYIDSLFPNFQFERSDSEIVLSEINLTIPIPLGLDNTSISANGNYIIWTSDRNNVEVFNIASKKSAGKFTEAKVISSLSITADGTCVVVGFSDGSVIAKELKSGRKLYEAISVHSDGAYRVAIDNSCSKAASVGDFDDITVHEFASGESRRFKEVNFVADRLAFSENSELVYADESFGGAWVGGIDEMHTMLEFPAGSSSPIKVKNSQTGNLIIEFFDDSIYSFDINSGEVCAMEDHSTGLFNSPSCTYGFDKSSGELINKKNGAEVVNAIEAAKEFETITFSSDEQFMLATSPFRLILVRLKEYPGVVVDISAEGADFLGASFTNDDSEFLSFQSNGVVKKWPIYRSPFELVSSIENRI